MRFPVSLLVLALATPAVHAATPQPPADLSRLTAAGRVDLRCAAAFAIVATQQAGGDALAGWPPLAARGKRFFADTGTRVMAEAGLARQDVRTALAAEVTSLQSAKDPEAALASLAKPCLDRLDASVPPLTVPDLNQCAAILTLAADELHAREGMTPAAQDVRTLASVLTAREREALIAKGKTGDEADRTVIQARDAMAAEADDDKGGIDKYDVAHCYDLAKPSEKTHY
ncbi:hypothetical protein GGQ88_001003 [Novosphingobium hassiacum]|uniref:Uncharacterized protein n=1 Tax=Novosphingobium hassiacum TaxID=173676 RepID=A0A7W6EUZ9_9SPHN|nr:hypothetical protein [Novosphingobium hassiacum]MBB3859742.1 hypothetical protein [Novosphingobium hassiacum]